jgi:hypothetical protein
LADLPSKLLLYVSQQRAIVAPIHNVLTGAWIAFVLPKGMPATIVHKLQNATVVAMSSHSTKERLKEFGSVFGCARTQVAGIPSKIHSKRD